MTEVHRGIVKFFRGDRGYGFIVDDQAGVPDWFVHISDIKRAGLSELTEGQRVAFELEVDKFTKGQRPKATNIELLG